MVVDQAVQVGAQHSGTERQETTALGPTRHLQPALAVLLTQISNSHASLVENLQHRKQGASQAVHSNANSLKNVSKTFSEPEAPVKPQVAASADNDGQQQASDDELQRLFGQTRELLPYQQELVDVILQSDNSIVFLPNGMLAVLS